MEEKIFLFVAVKGMVNYITGNNYTDTSFHKGASKRRKEVEVKSSGTEMCLILRLT